MLLLKLMLKGVVLIGTVQGLLNKNLCFNVS
jgi:hypothetical protein